MKRSIVKTLMLSVIIISMASEGVVASSTVPEVMADIEDVSVEKSSNEKTDVKVVDLSKKTFDTQMYVVNGILYIENANASDNMSWIEIPWVSKKEMLLVNKSFPITKELRPDMDNKCRVLLEKNCSSALRTMQAECQSATGRWPAAISGYRTFGYQSKLFNRYLRINSGDWQKVNSFVAVSGQSEHHTGLSMDLVVDKQYFGYTAEYTWLKNNCYRYGFIERYPNEKTGVTGYVWEPWHYRYVGNMFANHLHTNGLTMEEFYQQLKKQKSVQIGSKYVRLLPSFYYVTATQSTAVEVYATNTGECIVVTDY